MTRDENYHPTSLKTLISTSVACLGAAALIYPIEEYHAKWKSKYLTSWADEQVQVPKRSRAGLVLSPFARLTLHEFAATVLPSEAEHRLKTFNLTPTSVSKEILAGCLAGFCQALVLCPLETRRAKERQTEETERNKSWRSYLKQQFVEGGSLNPSDRLSRAYRGVGLLALREMVFNVSFFPLFSYLRHELKHDEGAEHFSSVFTSGVLAGLTCSLLVVPIDICRLYYWYSGEKFSIFFGTQVSAPPMTLLLRGWVTQAAIFGPTFGLVASVYEIF